MVVAPVCIVSKAHFLSRSGWTPTDNSSSAGLDVELPFALARESSRTHLQVRCVNYSINSTAKRQTPATAATKKRRITKTKNFSVLNLLCSHFAFCNQWLGESWLRSLMEGRIVLVKLLCKDTANTHVGVFSPCIAFRVAGSPGTVYVHLLLTSLAFILLLLLLPHLLRVLGYGSSIVACGKTVLYLFVTHAIF